jgi:large subunit ribosomal protein L6
MFSLNKKEQSKNYLFFKSKVIFLNLFFVDLKIDIPTSISSYLYNNILFLTKDKNQLIFKNKKIFIFKKNNCIFIIINEKRKKNFKKLYKNLFLKKIKGLIQKFKLNLNLNGIGFKALIKNTNLILKLGFSHNILIKIPQNIYILNQNNKLIFYSIDFIFLKQFIHFIKKHKSIEPYKGKGLILNFEQILRKEGKKSKK